MSYDSKGVRSVTQGRASSAEEKNMPAPSANDSKRPSAPAALDLTPYKDKDQEIAPLTLINASVSQLIIWWQMLWVKIAL